MSNDVKPCQVCGRPVDNQHPTTALGQGFDLCEWCAFRTMQWIQGNINHSVTNIFWGFGRVGWPDWHQLLRPFIRKHGITEVLELGIGLSTELFVNEGLYVTGFDVLPQHVKLYQLHEALKGHGTFHHYEDRTPPPVQKLYPGRKWDFVFVDGPQERSAEVRVALETSSRFVCLHDIGYGEKGVVPNANWVAVEGDKIFEKI